MILVDRMISRTLKCSKEGYGIAWPAEVVVSVVLADERCINTEKRTSACKTTTSIF